MSYVLGVDLGTTYTAAAVLGLGGEPHPHMLGLGNRTMQIPSVLYRLPDGQFLVGDVAERRGLTDPVHLVREFKRRIGDPVPILVGGSPFSPQSLTARLLRWVVDQATQRMGGPPDRVVLTHPANWTSFKIDLLRQAAVLADLRDVTLLTEPEAAAYEYVSRAAARPGDLVCVYDLGGGTFDVCVLQVTPTRGVRILGTPEGIEHLGGIDFDEAIFRQALQARSSGSDDAVVTDPALELSGLARLRRDCIEAKESLSVDSDATITLGTSGGPSALLQLTRPEFEDAIRPAIGETVVAVDRALRSAGVDPADLVAFVLVGGSSRIPLITQELAARYGRPVAANTHPKHDIAMGAARAGLAGRSAPLLQTPPTPPSGAGAPTRPPVPAAGPVQPPASRAGSGPSRMVWIALAAVLATVAVIVVTVVVTRSRSTPAPVAGPGHTTVSAVTTSRADTGAATTSSTAVSSSAAVSSGADTGTPATPAALPVGRPLRDSIVVAPRQSDLGVDLYLVDSETGSPGRRITFSGATAPVISPDRRSVIYVSRDLAQLRVVGVDGTGDRALLTTNPEGCDGMFRPAWNPVDPTQLAVVCFDAEHRYSIVLLTTDGAVIRWLPVDQPKADDVTFAPDGRTVAFWAGRESDLGGGSLYTMATDGSAPAVKLTDGGRGTDADPMYAPDGERLVFRRFSVDDGKPNLDIMTVDVATGAVTTVDDNPAIDQDPTWSPDGTRILFKSDRPTPGQPSVAQLWVMNADGTDIHRLVPLDTKSQGYPAAWGRR